MTSIYVNGEIVPSEKACISVFDQAFLFGEGLFETFRAYDKKLPFLNDHLGRLEWAAMYLNLPFDLPDVAAICQNLLAKNNLENARFKLVLSQTRWPQRDTQPTANLVIFCDALDESALESPYKIKTVTTFKNDDGLLATLKTTNYLTKRLARREAEDSGFDDGILVNSKNQVTETATANIFWVDASGRLKTIAPDCHHLAGILQKNLIKLLSEHKLKCAPDVIAPNDLSHAREIFLTNSIIGIKPVVAVDHRQISGGKIGDITLMIRDLWQKHVKDILDTEIL